MSVRELGNDRFAQIGAQPISTRDPSLVEPAPPQNPRIDLPLTSSPGSLPVVQAQKIDSEAELLEALTLARREYAPFLTHQAPPAQTPRRRLVINTFSWRVEEKVPAAHKTWQTIRFPHFGKPLGKAVAWYRAEITSTVLEAARIPIDGGDAESNLHEHPARAVYLCFKGVDYRADVFLNDVYLGSHEGFFEPFEFECAKVLRRGVNILLVKVENDAIQMGNEVDGVMAQGDKIYAATGPGFDDPETGWHHCPPGMGIYQEVYLESRSRQHVRDLFIRPLPEESRIETTVEIENADTEDVPVTIAFSIFGENFRETTYEFEPLPAENPAGPGPNYYRYSIDMGEEFKRWEPESPFLYLFRVSLHDGNGDSLDEYEHHFGMRSFRMDTNGASKGHLYLNGREIRLRGTNEMGHLQRCVMEDNIRQLIDDILLAKICNINFFRMTQRPVHKEIYLACDMLGMMAQTDLPFFGCIRRNTVNEALRQAVAMERLVRNHPANICVSYINEPFPNSMGKPQRHLSRVEMETFFECADRLLHMENPDQFIKHVDGDYDPPTEGYQDNHCYCGWYNGHGVDLGRLHKGYWQRVKPGWTYGCGEFGAEGLDQESTMRKYYPAEWLPSDERDERTWTPDRITKAQTGKFHFMWFETKHTLTEWIEASQAHQAWATKLMTLSFRRDNRMNSFAIHLFIDAWPAGWMKTIMDVDRHPKAAYFVYRDALSPVNVHIRTDRYTFYSGERMELEVWGCNDTGVVIENLRVRYHLSCGGAIVEAGETPCTLPALRSTMLGILRFTAPEPSGAYDRMDCTAFVALLDERNRPLHSSEETIPTFRRRPVSKKSCAVIGSVDRLGARLARDLGLSAAQWKGEAVDALIVDSYQAYDDNREAVDASVRNGTCCLLLELPAGTYTVGDERLTVQSCGMSPVHFAARAPGRPEVAGFQENDFRFWFDPDVGYVTPILDATFESTRATAILTSGNGEWQSGWREVLAVGEIIAGRGRFVICQVKLAGRTRSVPVAERLAARLLRLQDE